MSAYLLPILYTVFVWWFGTGIILYLNGLPRWTFKWTMVAATLLLVLALLGLYASADSTRIGAAYLAFTCAIASSALCRRTPASRAFAGGTASAPGPADCRTAVAGGC